MKYRETITFDHLCFNIDWSVAEHQLRAVVIVDNTHDLNHAFEIHRAEMRRHFAEKGIVIQEDRP
jgi:hypothetical protein